MAVGNDWADDIEITDTEKEEIEYVVPESKVVSIDSVKPHPRNYNKHPEEQLDHIRKSIQEHGLYKNVVTAKDGTILAGHGVYYALKSMDRKDISVVTLDIESDDPRALKIIAGDNGTAKMSTPDEQMLIDLLNEIKDSDITDLVGSGFDDNYISDFLADSKTKEVIAGAGEKEVDENIETTTECPNCGYKY